MCAHVAQLGERQTEDLKVLGSIPSVGIILLKEPSYVGLSSSKHRVGFWNSS